MPSVSSPIQKAWVSALPSAVGATVNDHTLSWARPPLSLMAQLNTRGGTASTTSHRVVHSPRTTGAQATTSGSR